MSLLVREQAGIHWVKGVCLVTVLYICSISPLAVAVNDTAGHCADTEQPGTLATIALLEKKTGIGKAAFRDYWRDVHGVLAARIPGFWTYTQYHLGEEFAKRRVNPSGIDSSTDHLHGFAEVTFCSEEDRSHLIESYITDLIKQDEQNVFSSSYLYATRSGDSRTIFKYSSPTTISNEETRSATYIALVARVEGTEVNALRANVEDQLRDIEEQCEQLRKLRVHFFSAYDENAWQAPNVNHVPDQVYDAAFEVKFDSSSAGEECLGNYRFGGRYARSESGINFIQFYKVDSVYQMVRGGRPTLMGLRGLPAAKLIDELGAENQKNQEVLRLLFGSHAVEGEISAD